MSADGHSNLPLSRAALAAAFAAALAGVAPSAADAVVTASISGNGVIAGSDGESDSIVVTCVGGNVKVNGTDPTGGPKACIDVNAFDVQAQGGNDTLDLGAVVAPDFNLADLDIGVSTLVGGAGNDFMTGLSAKAIWSGDAGSDTLIGSARGDSQNGGPGDDFIDGRGGADTINGSEDNDRIDAGADGDVIKGNEGDDRITGGPGDDSIEGGDGLDRLIETADGDFRLFDTQLLGSADTLTGFEQAELTGGDGNNRIDASAFSGPVTLTGGGGADTLIGGAFADLIFARDSLVDLVDCGGESDQVQSDFSDVITGCEAVDSTSPPPAPGAPPAGATDSKAPLMRFGGGSITLRGNSVAVVLTCPPDEQLCAGALSLQTKDRVTVSRKRRLSLGRKAFSIAGGKRATVRIRVSRKNARILAQLKQVKVTLRAAARDRTGNTGTTTRTVTLKVAKTKRRR